MEGERQIYGGEVPLADVPHQADDHEAVFLSDYTEIQNLHNWWFRGCGRGFRARWAGGWAGSRRRSARILGLGLGSGLGGPGPRDGPSRRVSHSGLALSGLRRGRAAGHASDAEDDEKKR